MLAAHSSIKYGGLKGTFLIKRFAFSVFLALSSGFCEAALEGHPGAVESSFSTTA